MKKNVFFIVLSFLGVMNAFSQSLLPDSYLNVGIGAGVNYGIPGTKTVLGYKNSGLLVGLGYFPDGVLSYEIGGQISAEWFYANIGYGLMAAEVDEYNKVTTINGGNITLGGMIGLGRAKRVFIDLGIGHTFGIPPILIFGHEISRNAFTFSIGVGYRIGEWYKLWN